MAVTKPATTTEVVVNPIQTKTIRLSILGTRPLICNRMAEKAKRELLLPAGRRTTADRASSLKHDPLAEFRSSPYIFEERPARRSQVSDRYEMAQDMRGALRGGKTKLRPGSKEDRAATEYPTYLAALAAWFKGAMMTAALELPGTKKAQIGRIVWIEGERLPLYGEPELLMSVTRSADMNKTPDIRTRVIVPRWACEIDVTFTTPMLTERSIVNLVAAAGLVSGVGDWRNEKGKGTYGQFVLADPDSDLFQEILATGGRDAQRAAMETPRFYDDDSADLFAWFQASVRERGRGGQLESLPTAAD